MAFDLVRVEHILKSFSGVAALDDVQFDLRSGIPQNPEGELMGDKAALGAALNGRGTNSMPAAGSIS
jgi:ABC-type sugar transport system ATPase subunit